MFWSGRSWTAGHGSGSGQHCCRSSQCENSASVPVDEPEPLKSWHLLRCEVSKLESVQWHRKTCISPSSRELDSWHTTIGPL